MTMKAMTASIPQPSQPPYSFLMNLLHSNNYPFSTTFHTFSRCGSTWLAATSTWACTGRAFVPNFQKTAMKYFQFVFFLLCSDAEKMTEKAEKSRLKTRLQFHLSHKWVIIITEKPDCNTTKLGNIWLQKNLKSAIFCRFGDEKKLMQFHQELEDVIEDQLSLGRK